MRTLLAITVSSVLVVSFLVPAGAEGRSTEMLPNRSFEAGETGPAGWKVSTVGAGGRESDAYDGESCLGITGMGDDSTWWAPVPGVSLEPDRFYYVSYWARRGPQAIGGVAIAGLDWVNRDANPPREWQKYTFFLRTPDAVLIDSFFRLGQWHVKGTVLFDQVDFRPAFAVQRRPEGLNLPLGEGERVRAGRYTAEHRLSGLGTTGFRCLERFDARFNSNRWVFDDAAEVVYRHRVGRLRQAESEVEVAVNWWERGSLVIEASRDGEEWAKVGEMSGVKRVGFPVPAEVLPAREVWIRLRSTEGSALQVDGYEYGCRLQEAGSVVTAVGGTQYFALLRETDGLEVEVQDVGNLIPGGDSEVELLLESRGVRRVVLMSVAIERDGAPVALSQRRISLPAGVPSRVALPYRIDASGDHTLTLRCLDAASGETLWEVQSEFRVSPLYDARGGQLLADDPEMAVWWCEPEWKVSQRRPAPERIGSAVQISAAGNEYEAAQLVLTPRESLRECRLSVSDLVTESGARIPASEVDIRTVEYLLVARPTDEVGSVDHWPDPLPLHTEATALEAGRNQPFWITVHIPSGTPAGDYLGEIEIATEQRSWGVPLQVHVWGFDLPEETHVRSGFGLWQSGITRYHNLETEAEQAEVFDLYLRSFAEHRVAPYSVGAEIGVDWRESSAGVMEPELDFSAFDESARHALDELGFNSFVLDLEGLGGGTFHSRRLGNIAGFEQGTPEHEAAFTRYVRAVQDHLEARGWLDRAYVYWFDEPAERDYEFVRDGMELIRRAGPKLTRMLTEQPTPELYGAVDLWCIPTYMLDEESVQRRKAAGEEIWWYLCTGPKAPYFTLFLDHHGTEMRLWLWETWKYGLDGILVWQTNYWTSRAAYPGPAVQNPWEDAMSWTSGYSTAAGVRNPWGNGDGRFFYPPNRDPANDKSTHLGGPVPSIRWELLRDGIEDYEYFWLLREEIARLRGSGADPSVYREAEKLLEVPPEVCSSLTHFTTTPEPIHQHRARLAEAIERLRGF